MLLPYKLFPWAVTVLFYCEKTVQKLGSSNLISKNLSLSVFTRKLDAVAYEEFQIFSFFLLKK